MRLESAAVSDPGISILVPGQRGSSYLLSYFYIRIILPEESSLVGAYACSRARCSSVFTKTLNGICENHTGMTRDALGGHRSLWRTSVMYN